MRTKIQLKLNSDILLTVIQMLEESGDYAIQSINDALLISIREDLIDKLADKSKTIQKQVSILDHAKKHIVVLKYHEAYCLSNLLDVVCAKGQFDSHLQIKKIKRLVVELKNKTNISTKEDVCTPEDELQDVPATEDALLNFDLTAANNKNTETNTALENVEIPHSDLPSTTREVKNYITESAIQNSETVVFDFTQHLVDKTHNEVIPTTLPTLDSAIEKTPMPEEALFDTFFYPIEDNFNEQLTNLAYTFALEEVTPTLFEDKLIFDQPTETPLEQVETSKVESAIEPVLNEVEANIDTVDATTAESTIEPVLNEVEESIDTVDATTAESTIEPVLNEVETNIDTVDATTAESTIEPVLNEVEASNAGIPAMFQISEIEVPKEKKHKAKKEPQPETDQGQMSLF